jgi:hypothetical protein
MPVSVCLYVCMYVCPICTCVFPKHTHINTYTDNWGLPNLKKASGGIASVCVGREREEESVCVGSERGRERRWRRRVVALVCFDELSGERVRVEVEGEAPKDEKKV